ncbi:MAG: STAS domain-containing protein [Nocardiopsaceae bacterium]|nr:STAS domain-containing protein [Nocardiopsaceae bacterium]
MVLLDLSGLSFCDVTGLNALVRARRILGERGAWLALAAPPPSLTKLLAVTGLDQLFEVFPQPARPQELPQPGALPTGLPAGLPQEALRDRRPYPARGARIGGRARRQPPAVSARRPPGPEVRVSSPAPVRHAIAGTGCTGQRVRTSARAGACRGCVPPRCG